MQSAAGDIGIHPGHIKHICRQSDTLLNTGGEAYTYQSCTAQPRLPVVLQGEFTFVKGLLSDADAPRFTARVSSFDATAV